MQSKDKDQAAGHRTSQDSGAARSTLKDAGILGGLRSIATHTKEGGATVAIGMRSLTSAAKDVLEPGRIETFDQAMRRLGVVEADLPLIHNQIALQCYITLVVAIMAMASTLVFALGGSIVAPSVAFIIFLTCMVKAAQSSIQCLSIRERRLGMNAIWLGQPGVWIPRRIAVEREMDRNDPLRDPKLVNKIASSARRSFATGAGLVGLSVAWGFLFPGNQWSLLYVGIAMATIFFGAKNSFEVYKRRSARHCDMLPWLADPSSWIPELTMDVQDEPGAVIGAKSRRGSSVSKR